MRDRLPDFEGPLLRIATGESFKVFDEVVGDWVRLADEDGTCAANQRRHEHREFRPGRDFDGGWSFEGGCGSLAGVEVKAILDHFVEAEFRTDWDKAKIEHGEATTKEHLERTDAQRRFDAFYAMCLRAASTEPGGTGPEIVTNVVIDDTTYERTLRALATGVRPEADIGADGVVIDLGRSVRLFTGLARLAAQLANTECFWPGCHVPVSQCQIDHLVPFTERDDGGGGGVPTPATGDPPAGNTTATKNTAPRSGATPPDNGTPTDPTAPKSNESRGTRPGFAHPGTIIGDRC